MAFDITKNLRSDLMTVYNWGPRDMNTLLARKMSQERQQLTSTAVLYDGDDILDEVRTYLNQLTTV